MPEKGQPLLCGETCPPKVVFLCNLIVDFNEIINGYLISLTFTLNVFKHTILNVYSPSDSTDRTCFFTQLETSLTHLDFNGFVCLGGDFNCTMDSSIDRNGKEPHPVSIMPLARTLTTFSLIDIWRTFNPSA